MAFNLNRWGRQTDMMNAGRILLQDGTPDNAPAYFTYASATDSLATIAGANYFSEAVYDLAVSDIIYGVGSDTSANMVVTAVNRGAGTITVTIVSGGGGGGGVNPGSENSLAYYATTGSTVSGLVTTESAVLTSTSAGAPVWTDTMTDGQVVIGSTSGTPAAATLTAGGGITITNGAGSISIAATGGAITWTTLSSATQAAVINNGYIAGNSGATTVTLPATAPIGSVVAVEGLGAGGWVLTANTGQTIKIGSSTTSSAGTLTSAAASDNVYVTCIVADTTWRVRSTNSAGLTVA